MSFALRRKVICRDSSLLERCERGLIATPVHPRRFGVPTRARLKTVAPVNPFVLSELPELKVGQARRDSPGVPGRRHEPILPPLRWADSSWSVELTSRSRYIRNYRRGPTSCRVRRPTPAAW